MRILGLDPSLTNFGWVLHDTDALGCDRCIARGRFRTPAKMLFVERYVTLRENLRTLVQESGVRYVGIESPVFNDLWSEGMYGLFLYSCEALWSEGVDTVFFAPNQIKVHARLFLGRPTKPAWVMKKPDMVEAARMDTGGHGRWNHNEADAYWAARTAGRFWMFVDGDGAGNQIGEEDLTQPEKDQFTKVHVYKRGKKQGRTEYKGITHREDDRFFRWYKDNTEDKYGEAEEDEGG